MPRMCVRNITSDYSFPGDLAMRFIAECAARLMPMRYAPRATALVAHVHAFSVGIQCGFSVTRRKPGCDGSHMIALASCLGCLRCEQECAGVLRSALEETLSGGAICRQARRRRRIERHPPASMSRKNSARIWRYARSCPAVRPLPSPAHLRAECSATRGSRHRHVHRTRT